MLIPILQILIIASVAAAFARRIIGHREPDFASTGERLVFEVAIGLGMLGLLIFALGALQLFYMPALLGLLIVMAAVAWRELSAVVSGLTTGIRDLRKVKWTPGTALVGAILSAVSVFALLAALAPPVADDWDSLAYHLAMPKLFLAHHGIYYIPFASHSNFPFTWEMLYTLGLGFGSVALAKLLHFAAGVLLVGAVWSFAKRHFSSGMMPAFVVAGIPMVAYEATTAYVDLTAALFAFLVAYALTNLSAAGDRRWVLIAGIAAGLAAGVKMTGLVMPLIAVAWILWPGSTPKSESKLKLAAVAAGLAFLFAAPWYIKTLIYTGNPVYPFLYSVFGGRNWSVETAGLYRADQLMFGVGRDQTAGLMLPWNLTFHFARFVDYAARAKPGNELPAFTGNALVYLATIGPIFLAALPALLVSLLKRGIHRPLIAVAFVLGVVWFFSMQNTRYLLPALAILAPASVYSMESIGLRRLTYAIAGATAAFTLLLLVQFALPALPDLGKNQPTARADSFGLYQASAFINDNLPSDAKIALFGETRGFYLNREYFWADQGNNAIIPYSKMGLDPANLLDWLEGHGFGYVLVNKGNIPDFGELLVGRAVGHGLEEIYTSGPDPERSTVVYRISE